jgi:hypothetical protein
MQDATNPVSFPYFIVCRIFLFPFILCDTSSFLTSVQLISSILLQHYTDNLSSYFWSTFCSGGPLMVAQWLRYCDTNRKVVGSIPDGVMGIFH